jgi:hypothetical protein
LRTKAFFDPVESLIRDGPARPGHLIQPSPDDDGSEMVVRFEAT